MSKEKLYPHKKLKSPQREDFFVATGEVEFQHGYQQTGYFNDVAFQKAEKQHNDLLMSRQKCENRRGYYCTKKECRYPKCYDFNK